MVYFLIAMLTVAANAGEFATSGSFSVPPPQTTQPSARPSQNERAPAAAANPASANPNSSRTTSQPAWSAPAQPVKPYVAPIFRNGAGPTGLKWDSGNASKADIKKFDSEGAGKCGEGQNIWAAVATVMSDNVIPARKGYDLLAPSWPRVSGSQSSLKCDFGTNKQSMCTSATAAALCQHFVNLIRSEQIQLTPTQIQFLNSSQFKALLNGNTFSVAKLFQHLGGASVFSGNLGGVRVALSKAQTGDIVRFDRKNGTGHSAIFKELTETQFCYWTSNTGTKGVGVQCEYIGPVSQMVISRFPDDLENMGTRLDAMRTALLGFGSAQANTIGPDAVTWTSDLSCPDAEGETDQKVATSPGAD